MDGTVELSTCTVLYRLAEHLCANNNIEDIKILDYSKWLSWYDSS